MEYTFVARLVGFGFLHGSISLRQDAQENLEEK